MTPSQIWSLLGIPLLIFSARVLDVSLGTFRISLVSRGIRQVAPLIGLLEILIWLVALGQVVQNLDRPLNYLAYAGGFAAGTWVGLLLDDKMAFGLLSVRVITSADASELIEALAAHRFGVTTVAARGLKGRVRLIFAVIRRKEMSRLSKLIEEHHPGAFVTVSDVRIARHGFLHSTASLTSPFWRLVGKK